MGVGGRSNIGVADHLGVKGRDGGVGSFEAVSTFRVSRGRSFKGSILLRELLIRFWGGV